jgi:acetylaranotin biosynthesis cluster protein L
LRISLRASAFHAEGDDLVVQASRTIKVNDDPRETPLPRGLIWRGLVMKAENPLPFVPVISSCQILERRHDGLLRKIVDKGDTITEIVTFHPERMVKFERTSGRVLGTILNEIIEDRDGDLALKFTFDLSVAGMTSGSAEEEEFASQMEAGYLMAVQATLKAMRKLAADSALHAAS